MKWLIIGISGATCSGKTTVAKQLHESIENSILINQDTYFLPQDDARHTMIPELNHFNWEILSSLDMEKMHSDITEILKSKSAGTNHVNTNGNASKVLIIEGFIIYSYKPIVDLCNKKYFIEIDYDTCWNRRKVRVYDPPDIPGYFDKVVWPEYLKHKSEITSDSNICQSVKFLDGRKTINQLYTEVFNDVKKFL